MFLYLVSLQPMDQTASFQKIAVLSHRLITEKLIETISKIHFVFLTLSLVKKTRLLESSILWRVEKLQRNGSAVGKGDRTQQGVGRRSLTLRFLYVKL